MAYIQGVGRKQGTLFPVTLEELIPANHVCRVIDAFVGRLDMERLGFARAEAAETGRPGYDPRDLLRLYLYGYLHQIRSSRRLEGECQRNIEVMWLLGRLAPDHKSIAEFRRLHGAAVTDAGAELIRFARSVGLVRGEWVAIDGSKFRAVSSSQSVHERRALERYLEGMEQADAEEEVEIDSAAVAAALEKLKQHPEPEARFMRTPAGKVPAYNVQTAVDAEHALIVAQQVSTEATDNRSLEPMAEAAQAAVSEPGQKLNVVADAGYSNGEQAERCESKGIVPHVPANRGVNNRGDGTLFQRSQFLYEEASDTFLCPAGQRLNRRQRKDRYMVYAAPPEVCGACPLKSRCTVGKRRLLKKHQQDGALERMQQRATAKAMRLRRSIAEHPFAALKYQIFGHPRFLLRGTRGAQTEISLGVMAYNLKRMINILGGSLLAAKFALA
ncbi:MAG: IS1182 family transposase [Acidobacteriia bacterium]|nr:IS1182 family transposase [Terriglobia bacterium]